MKNKVYIETHGCQMNVADSVRAVRRLGDAGFALTLEATDADVIVLNTCSVRARAEAKVFNRIGQIRNVSEKQQLIGVMGCVAQLEGENLFKRSSAIDFVIGTRATDRLPDVIAQVINGAKQVYDLDERKEGESWDVNPSDHPTNGSAFVPIIEGCNKFCSYCIVPFSRGREKSRAASEIISEVNVLREAGYVEVQLIGQNVNSYRPRSNAGLEIYEGATPFVRLLRAVAATGMKRIKFTTSFPRDFHPEIVGVINEHQNLCNWVHLPVQSGSDAVLKRMRRGYKSGDYLARVEAIHNSPREVSLTTDIIIGFPGETEDDFAQTLDLTRRCLFHGMYIFKYSERAGTYAAGIKDDVPQEEKSRRFFALEELQTEIQQRIYGSYIGKTLNVLVQGLSARSGGHVVGHSTCNKVVNFPGSIALVGTTVNIRITAAKQNSLLGELISQ